MVVRRFLLACVALAAAAPACAAAPARLAVPGPGADPLRLELHLRGAATAAELAAAIERRTTPGDSLFQQHMGPAELRAFAAAPAAAAAAVEAALLQAGCPRRALQTFGAGDVVTCTDLPASAAERLGLGDRVAAAASASAAACAAGRAPAGLVPGAFRVDAPVPAGLAARVASAIVARGSVMFRVGGRWTRAAGAAPAPRHNATPGMLRARYGVPSGPVAGLPAGFSVGVAEFAGEFFEQADVTSFLGDFGVPSSKVRVHGPFKSSFARDESTLDLEYIMGTADGALPTFWLSGSKFDLSLWGEGVLSMGAAAPRVISVSWGSATLKWKRDVMEADNRVFQKMALAGLSVLVATGDSGPGARYCLPPSMCHTFSPQWPATSPWVTAVGATQIGADGTDVTTTWSGGGFSPVFSRPAWQAAAVDRYLSTQAAHLPFASFNRSGRAIPDVASLGVDFRVMYDGAWWSMDGTSASTPVVAAMVGRINAARMGAGRPALGFLNPALYRAGRVGQDVVEGATVNRQCCSGYLPGFPTAPGWDAATGLGVPSFRLLSAALH